MKRRQSGGASAEEEFGGVVPMVEFAHMLKEAIPTTLGEIPWVLEEIIMRYGNVPERAQQ